MRNGSLLHVKRLILPVYLPMMLLSVGMTAPIAAFPQYLGSLGASVAVVGLILSLRGMGNLVSDLPGGFVLGRVRLRPVMAVSLALATVTSILIWLTRSVAMIGILILLSGASLSFVITAMMTHVRVAIPASTRGRALSLVGGSLRVGALIGPFAGGLLADVFGAHTTFLLRACCNAAALAAFLADRRIDQAHSRPSPDTAARGTQKTGGVRLVDQFAAVASGLKGRWRAVITVGFAVLMLMLMRSSRGLVLPLWGDRLSLSATVIGSVISAGAAMDLLLFIPAGVIMDRAGRKVAAGICIGVFMVGLVLLSVSRGVMGFVFASMLIGIGNGFGAGINMTLGTDLAPNGAISEFLGLWRFYGDIGQTTGPAIVGALAAAIGLGPGILAIAGGGLAGLLVLVLIAPETLRLADKVSDGPQPR